AHGLTRRAGLSAARRRGVVIRRSGSNVARGLADGVTAKFEPRRLKLELERGNADVELRTRNEKFKALSSHADFRLHTSHFFIATPHPRRRARNGTARVRSCR